MLHSVKCVCGKSLFENKVAFIRDMAEEFVGAEYADEIVENDSLCFFMLTNVENRCIIHLVAEIPLTIKKGVD